MIRIATPVSHLFKDPAAAETIRQASDCLECREWAVDIEYPGQELFHIDHNVNHPWDHEIREFMEKALRKTGVKLVTVQMASCYSSPTIVEGMYQPGGHRYSRDEMVRNVRENVRWMRSIAPQMLIGIENNNYYPTPAYDVVTDGDFISEVVSENDLYFLLDIAHAQVTAHNQKSAYIDYLATLPMDRLIQLHICQPAVNDRGLAYDAHGAPNSDMIAEVARLCGRHAVRYLTVEYYKDVPNLLSSLKALEKIPGVKA